MKKLLILILLFPLFIISCLTKSHTTTKKMPKWAVQRPLESEYYIGIGKVKKPGNEDYVKSAKAQALSDLASEITVSLSGQSVFKQIEENEQLKESFQSVIKTSVQQNLEDYEIAGSWEDKTTFMIYFKLNKKIYQDNKRKKLQQVETRAKELFKKAETYRLNKEYLPAIENYIASLFTIQDHLDGDFSVSTSNGRGYLIHKVPEGIKQCYENIHLQTISKPDEQKNQKKPFSIQVTSDKGNISGLPLKVEIQRGNHIETLNIKTNQNGKISQLEILPSKGISRIKTDFDVDKFLNTFKNKENTKTTFISQIILNTQPLPSHEIVTEVKKVLVYIEAEEMNIGEPLKQSILENTIKRNLSSLYFNFTKNKDKAEYIIKISSFTSKKSEQKEYDLYMTDLSGNISIYRVKDQLEIYSRELIDIKGIKHGSYKNSGVEAYKNAKQVLEETIIPEILKLSL